MVVVAGGAEGEFGHVEPAEVERAGGIEPGQRRRGLGRLPVPADRRAAARFLAGAVIHVLLCQRPAGPRPEFRAALLGRVDGLALLGAAGGPTAKEAEGD